MLQKCIIWEQYISGCILYYNIPKTVRGINPTAGNYVLSDHALQGPAAAATAGVMRDMAIKHN